MHVSQLTKSRKFSGRIVAFCHSQQRIRLRVSLTYPHEVTYGFYRFRSYSSTSLLLLWKVADLIYVSSDLPLNGSDLLSSRNLGVSSSLLKS